MNQKLTQQNVQTQQQTLGMAMSPVQLLATQLIELPISELEERVNLEMNDNPALEGNIGEAEIGEISDTASDTDNMADDDFETSERQDALQDVLMSIGSDDVMPSYHNDFEGEIPIIDESSTYIDELKNQISEHDLTEKQQFLLEYLIGSLDADGYLRKNLSEIVDELTLFHNVDVTEAEIQKVLDVLHDFDPPGIGAKDLQECLLLQINRRQTVSNMKLTNLMRTVVEDYYKAFTLKHWKEIQKWLKLSDVQAKCLFKELTKLNPKPAASMGEGAVSNYQQIVPDFIVENQDDGSLIVNVNNDRIPELKISQSYEDLRHQQSNSKQMREAITYAKAKMLQANNFIDALKLRWQTMLVTMKAIVEKQREFFEDGDVSAIKPMILKDIADRTGFSISTVSRVNNGKYVQTRWGIYPLKFFFEDSRFKVKGTEDVSSKQIKQALKELIENEDKSAPLSDQYLTDALKQQGFPVARRTVAKYREQMNYPIARLRK